jgi:hypothetical protein
VVQIHVRAQFYLRLMIADWRATDDSAASFYRKSAIENRKSFASVPQQPQERFRKPLIVGASPTRGSILRSEQPSCSERRMSSIASGRRRTF